MSCKDIFIEIKDEYDEMLYNSKANTRFIRKVFKNTRKYRNRFLNVLKKYNNILKKYNKAKKILFDLNIEFDDSSDEEDNINLINLFDKCFNKYLIKENDCNISMEITKIISVNESNNLNIFEYDNKNYSYNISNNEVYDEQQSLIGFLLMTENMFTEYDIIIDNKKYIVVKNIIQNNDNSFKSVISNKLYTNN